MQHVIKHLRAELEAVKADIARYEELRRKTPGKMRPSEWAMTIAKLKTNELEIVEAIQILSKVGKD